MCWRPQTSSYSYPRVVVIRIDVHPAGETRPTCHTHPTLSPHMVPDHTYLTRSTCSNISRSRQQSWAGSLLRHNPQHVDWPIRGFVPNFSSKIAIEAVGVKPIFCWRPTTWLIGHISPACDRYVQYLLTGVNPSVLNRHRWGLQPPKGARSVSGYPIST
jgi:hypothetical protein